MASAAPGHSQQLAAMLAALARVSSLGPERAVAAPGGDEVVIWTGPSSAPPPRRGDRGRVVTLLGAADFTRHLAATAGAEKTEQVPGAKEAAP